MKFAIKAKKKKIFFERKISYYQCALLSVLIRKLKYYIGLAGVAQWIEHRLRTKESPVQFPVRARAWVVGQVPSTGHVRGNHTLEKKYII